MDKTTWTYSTMYDKALPHRYVAGCPQRWPYSGKSSGCIINRENLNNRERQSAYNYSSHLVDISAIYLLEYEPSALY